ncbi:dTDP-4-dehydrorhamnose reductase [Noviherbaspirillum cavernae]|uniref:dTDP-4-dehydrorhamnose reductase n=1 Tax=Noviherbaspirillum cavernae TaxID=2320862 RepID=A0A418X034_9BURK|nr:dTDP-4-dehydrorhamnose reductase [Noviherbaspirillum cavernae]RJG05840.1 dTDP-4-dehydrorhamnose reductase [Noviherbaspirillum cavernae]
MKILLLGKDGQVGWELQRSLSPLGELHAFGHEEADLEDFENLRVLIRSHKPDIIVNAAAYTAVDKAETEADKARRINGEVVSLLAEEANRIGAWLIHYSTDYVFDGKKETAYVELDATNPLSVYGLTKLEGEQFVRTLNPNKHLIFRTSWVYAAKGSNFPKTILRLAKERQTLNVIADQHGAPTSAELIADVTALALYRILNTPDASGRFTGTYHLAAGGHTTWYAYAQYILELAAAHGVLLKTGPDAIEPISTESYKVSAARPRNSRLDTTKLSTTFNVTPPDWQILVKRMMDELASQGKL